MSSVMSARKTIRWGIIGVGNVCEIKSGPAFYKLPDSQLLAVMRRDGEKARDYAERHQVPQWYDNANDIIANPEIDAVYIATPPAQHKDYAIAAIKAGKQVYIEKPVTRNAAECDDIIAVAQQYNAKVCVAHYRRQLPFFLTINKLLQQGSIGTPLLVQIDMLRPATDSNPQAIDNWRVDPAVSGGGLFHDLSPHQLDLMLLWFGAVTQAQGFGYNQRQFDPADDCVHGWARLTSGVVLQGRWHFAATPGERRDHCEILGTEGKITFSFFGSEVINLSNQQGQQQIHVPHPQHIQQPLIEQINAYFRGERDNPSSLQDAKAVMALIDCFSQQ
jgi:1,5-anhydro-D-fructose reductase (1,5-anhydro-D-mannitol-forming)